MIHLHDLCSILSVWFLFVLKKPMSKRAYYSFIYYKAISQICELGIEIVKLFIDVIFIV